MEEGLGASFWFKVIGVVVGCGIGALLIFSLITAAAYRWGFFGALLIFGGALLVVAWFYDRKKAKEWGDEPGE